MSNTKTNESGIIAKKAPPRELIPAGNYLARCYSMILLGTIEEEFKGKKKKQTKVRITFELPNEMVKAFKEGEDDRPAAIGAEYTLSLSPKANMRKMLDSWRGKAFTEKEADGFDITKLLGKACMVNIIHKPGAVGGKNEGKFFEEIASVTPIPKGIACPEQVNETQLFNFGDKFDAEFVEKLPDFIKNKIKSSDEWQGKVADGIIAKSVEHAAAGEEQSQGAAVAEEEMPF